MGTVQFFALFGSAVFSAGSTVDPEANLPLTDDDIQLRTLILDLFKTVKPNHEHRMFLELLLQEDIYQYDCHNLRQADGSVDALPDLALDSDAKIRGFKSWCLCVDKNADIGIYDELYFEEIVLMHKGARVYFSNIPGMTLGALPYVNYGHDVDVLWRLGGYGLISSEQRAQAIRELDPQSKHVFVLSYLKNGERETGFICSSPADVNIYKDHERLDHPSRLRRMGF